MSCWSASLGYVPKRLRVCANRSQGNMQLGRAITRTRHMLRFIHLLPDRQRDVERSAFVQHPVAGTHFEGVETHFENVETHFGSVETHLVGGVLRPILGSVVCLSRSRFWRSSFVVRSCGFDCTVSSKFLPLNEANDRTKGDGFQTQKREGFMVGQVRKDELLDKAVVFDGRKVVFSRLLQIQRVDKSQVSEMQNRFFNEVAWKIFAGSDPRVTGKII